MRIEVIKAVFADEQLQQLVLDDKASGGNDTYIAKNITKCIGDEAKERCVQQFIASIEAQKGAMYERATAHLLDAFLGDLKHVKTEIPAAIQQSVDRVSALYKRGAFKAPIESPGTFPGCEIALSRLLEVANEEYAAHELEQLVLDHAHQDPVMKERKKARDARHAQKFCYDVITTKVMPKLMVCGTPRDDRPNCLADFYQMHVQEGSDVVVALNTFSDWHKAIRYYDADVLKGMNVAVLSVKELYRGGVATNIPKKLREEKAGVPLDDESLAAYRVRIEEREIKVEFEGKVRLFTHLHYINWPDHEAAPDEAALALLLDRHMELSGTSVVHCQGGVGRTLGYVQSLYIRHILNTTDATAINVPELTYELKMQAPRLGGSPKGARLAQVLCMSHQYYLTCMK